MVFFWDDIYNKGIAVNCISFALTCTSLNIFFVLLLFIVINK